MKNFISIDNIDLKSSSSIKSFITASSEIKECLITNVLQDNKNIWLSEDFLPQEIILNFKNIKLKEYPKKLTAIGVYCWNKYATNPKIIEVLISKENGNNFISLGHFDLSFKAGRQLIYLDDENDIELEELLSNVDFNDLIVKLVIKETFGGKHTYINNLYLYDKIDTNNINISNNNVNNNSSNMMNNTNNVVNTENIEEKENKEKNNINNENNGYMIIQENDIYDNDINDMNLNEIKNNEENNFNKFENKDNIKSNGNENENNDQDLIENVQNISNHNMIENNENMNINLEQDEYNKKQIIANNAREAKTPILIKEFQNLEDRPVTDKSLISRNINTTGRPYNNKNILINNNNGFNNIINDINYNEMTSSDKLNYLLNEFKNQREKHEYIMNNYESRIRLLEEKCFELKNNMKKMNATINTMIESQYNQNQESNNYLLRECHNMVNEAIVNILSNMGRNFNTYNPPIYGSQNMFMNRNRNINNNTYFNNYGNNPNNWRNNINNYMNKEYFSHREMDYDDIFNDNMNNENYNEDNTSNKDLIDENENGNEIDKINVNNNHEEEYLENEINKNNKEDEPYNNNDINKENENHDDYNLTNNNASMKMNNNIIMKNSDNKDKRLQSSDLHNDGIIPYEEKMKTYKNRKKNIFINNTNNSNSNTINVINANNNNNYNENNLINNNLNNNNTLVKSKSNTNIKLKRKNNSINPKKEINKNFQIFTEKRNIKRNIKPPIIKINDNDLSSDNSIDNIEINTQITENILKPTLEKFESYMNVNNFGKSQNVYSQNTFNKKKEIFGENNTDKKLTQSKGNKDK